MERIISDITDAYKRLCAEYEARTPKSRALFDEARRCFPSGTTRSNLYFAPYPPTLRSAAGAHVQDVDGRDYIDLISDYAVAQAGHSNALIAEGVKNQLDHGLSYGGRNEHETRLADLIKQRLSSVETLRFTNSGTEANLYAILAARAYSKKPAIFVFEGGYHGGVLNYAMHDDRLQTPFETLTAPYNDIDAFRTVVSNNCDKLGCVVMELMLNSGGCIPAEPAFAREVQAICRQAGVLLVVDEVMTTRLNYHGLQGAYGVTPDLTTLGKIIGGGLPVGAFGGRADIMAMFDQTQPRAAAHNGSFNNNVLTMAAGVAALSGVLTREALDAVNHMGEQMRLRLNEILMDHGAPLSFSGAGSVMALHVGAAPPQRFTSHPAASAVRALFHMHMLLQGFWIAQRGMLALSVETTQAHTDQFAAALDGFCAQYGDLLRSLDRAPSAAA